jgi:hypothetical protein
MLGWSIAAVCAAVATFFALESDAVLLAGIGYLAAVFSVSMVVVLMVVTGD